VEKTLINGMMGLLRETKSRALPPLIEEASRRLSRDKFRKIFGKSEIPYRCNICGTRANHRLSELTRESASCRVCTCNVRQRGMVALLVHELLGQNKRLDEIKPRLPFKGIGLSDDGYPSALEKAFGYTNSFFHKEPFLDICNVPNKLHGLHDFLISTDVFEHVLPPANRAFEGAYELLKPGGLFLFSVPFSLDENTVEHFPEIHDFKIEKTDGQPVLKNLTRDGREQIFNNLIFHGVFGETLEMRLFSWKDIERNLQNAGFRNIRIASEPFLQYGVFWWDPWSLPIVAQK
jgi:SAM-dependent methyltransferase